MSSNDVVQAVVQWANAAVPQLEGSYTYTPTGKTERLPDVVADTGTIEHVYEDPRFPMLAAQQVLLAVHSVGLSIMVENSMPQVAAEQLRDWADALSASLLDDGTLGGRVPMCSPIHSFDFTRPFVEYADGTRGRELTMELTVAVPWEQSW